MDTIENYVSMFFFSGENLPFVLHSLKQLEDALSSGALKRGDRVMVVGAGLSAADAVITSLENELKVSSAKITAP